ncbi:MAG: M23 family metallopeptidase [Clostridiales bacterium]|nr:M23 family metallopeptidase [Clostridiales bacterium]
MRQNKKQIDKVAVALVLCFCVVAIASVFTVRSGIDRLNNIPRPNVNIADRQTEADVIRPVVPIVDTQNHHEPPEQPAAPKTVPQFIVPVEGPISKAFSMDVPIFSTTLNQFMVHEGVDIAAPLDTPVKAIGDGTVIDVYNNDRYGITIVINHGGGLHSIYSNLSTATLIGIGDTVTQGQVISGVGDTALFEVLEGPHLHFSMKRDGEYVNPVDYIQFR